MAMHGNPEQLRRAEEMRNEAEKIESLPAQKKMLEVLDKALEGKERLDQIQALDRIQTFMEVIQNIESSKLSPETKQGFLKVCTRGLEDLDISVQDLQKIQALSDQMLDVRTKHMQSYNPDFAMDPFAEDTGQELPEGTLGYAPMGSVYTAAAAAQEGGGGAAPAPAPSSAPDTPDYDALESKLRDLKFFSKPPEFDNISTMENQIMNLGRLDHTHEVVGALDSLARIRAQFTGGEVRPDLIFEYGDKLLGNRMSVNKLAKATFGLNEKTLWEVYNTDFPGLDSGDPINNPGKIAGLPKFIQRQYGREERADRHLNKFKGKDGGKRHERIKAKEEKHDQIIRLLQNKALIKQFMVAVDQLSTYMPKSKLVGGQNAKQVERARWNRVKANETNENPNIRAKHAVIAEFFNPKQNGPDIKLTPIEWITHMGQWGHARPSVTSTSIGRETTGIQRFRGYDQAGLLEKRKLKKNQEVRARSDYSVYQELMEFTDMEQMVDQLEHWRQLGEQVRQMRSANSPRMKDSFKLPEGSSGAITDKSSALNAGDLAVFDVRLGQNFEQEMKIQRAQVEQTIEGGADASEALIEDKALYTQLTEEIARMENLTPPQRMRMKQELQNRMSGFFTLMYGVEDWNTPEGEERKKQLAAYLGAKYELIPGLFLEFGLGANNLLDARIFKPNSDGAGGFLQTGVEYRMNFGRDNKNEVAVGGMLQIHRQPVGDDSIFKPFAQVDYRRYFGEKGWFATAGATASLVDWSVRAGFGNDRERNLRGNFERWMDGEGSAKRQRGKGYGNEQWRAFKETVQGFDEGEFQVNDETPEGLEMDEIGKIALQNYLYKQMEYDYMVDQFSGLDAARVGFEVGLVAGMRWEDASSLPVGVYAGVGVSSTNLMGHRLEHEHVIHGEGVRTKDLYINREHITSSLTINKDSDAGALLDQMNESYGGVVEFTIVNEAPNDDLVQVRFLQGPTQLLNGRVSIFTDSQDNIPIIQPAEGERGEYFYTSLDTDKLPNFKITHVVDQMTGDKHAVIYMSSRPISDEDTIDFDRFAGGISYDSNDGGGYTAAKRFSTAEGTDAKRSVWESPDAYRSSDRYEKGNVSKKYEKELEAVYGEEVTRLKDLDFSKYPEVGRNRKEYAEAAKAKLIARHPKLKNKKAFRQALSEAGPGSEFDKVIAQVLGVQANPDTITYVKQGLLEIQRANDITKEAWCEKAMRDMISKEFAEAYYDFLITKYEAGEIEKLPMLTADEYMSGETATGTHQTSHMVLSKAEWGVLNGGELNAHVELTADIDEILTALRIPADRRAEFKAILEPSLERYVAGRRAKIAQENPVKDIDAFDADKFNACKDSTVSRIFMDSLIKLKTEAETDPETRKQHIRTLKALREMGIYPGDVLGMMNGAGPKNDEEQEKALAYMKMIDELYSTGQWETVSMKHAVHTGTLDSCFNPAVLDDLQIEIDLPELETHADVREHAYAIDPKAGVRTVSAKVPFMPKPKSKVSSHQEVTSGASNGVDGDLPNTMNPNNIGAH